MKVRDILGEKGNAVHSITPDVTVYEALKIMAEKNIGALVVTQGNKLSGIFSERDYSRKVILKGKSSKETTVGEIMNTDVITISENNEIDECMTLMTTRFVRHLPVLRNGELIGVISIGDVVKSIINEQQFIIENLGHYISGSHTGM